MSGFFYSTGIMVIFFYSWFIGEWSACSKTCGVGDRVRRVHCIQEVKNGQIEMMPFSNCKGDVPEKFEKCSVQKTCPEWKTDSWSEVRFSYQS